MSLLRKFVPRDALNSVWQRARRGDVPLKQSCPSCPNQMKEVPVETPAGLQCELDVCTHCQSVWLDRGEWHDLANMKVRERVEQNRRARKAPPPLTTPSSPQVQEASVSPVLRQSKPVRALRTFASRAESMRRSSSADLADRAPKVRPVKSHRRSPNAVAEGTRRRGRQQHEHVYSDIKSPRAWGEGPTEFWHWIPALLGLPVEDSQPAAHHKDEERPLLTWTLAVGIFLVSALAMLDLEPIIQAYGLVPAEFGRLGGLTWLTSFFLHVGPLHLLGNLYFLVVFGDNLEKCFGGLELFLLIMAAAVFGDFVHILFDPSSTIPCVGASGGISGVIAFYALRFPKTRLSMMFWLLKPFWFRMSAIWLFFLWILMQIVISGQQIAGLSGISGGAHLGGAFVGFVAWLLWRLGGGARDCRAQSIA